MHTASYLDRLAEQDRLPQGGFADRGIQRVPFGLGDLAIAELAAGGWTKTFTDPRLCAAIVDRLTFNGTIIEAGTDSYRLASTRARSEESAKALLTSVDQSQGPRPSRADGRRLTVHPGRG